MTLIQPNITLIPPTLLLYYHSVVLLPSSLCTYITTTHTHTNNYYSRYCTCGILVLPLCCTIIDLSGGILILPSLALVTTLINLMTQDQDSSHHSGYLYLLLVVMMMTQLLSLHQPNPTVTNENPNGMQQHTDNTLVLHTSQHSQL
jgi:hypothetical protein